MTDAKEQLEAIVAEMKEEKPFSVLDAIREVKYPTGKVRVYLDGEAAGRLAELYAEKQVLEADGSLTSQELNDVLAEIEELEASVKQGSLIFHMRGVPPKVRRIIFKDAARKYKIKKGDSEEEADEKSIKYNEAVTYETMRHAIVKVEKTADGSVDNHGWTVDEVAQLDDVLHASEFAKIDDLCAKLTGGANLFNETLDADFLSNS